MKFIHQLSVLMLLLGLSACQTAEQIHSEFSGEKYADKWLGGDKFKHFSAIAAAGTLSGLEMQRVSASKQDAVAVSITTAIIIGISKEIYDGTKPDNHFCYKDLTWDLLGAGLAVILLNRNL